MVEAGASFMVLLGIDLLASRPLALPTTPVRRPHVRAGSGRGSQREEVLTMGGVCFRAQDKVEAAADEDGGGDGARAGGGDKGGGEAEIEEMEPVEPLPEPPDDGGPIAWPMPDFCPLTVSDPPPIPPLDSNPTSLSLSLSLSAATPEAETLFSPV
jgi:hypothetical protein